MMQAATTRLTSRQMVMVGGKNLMQSPASPLIVKRMGKKMAQMQTVASSMGMKYCLTDITAASRRLMPTLRYSM